MKRNEESNRLSAPGKSDPGENLIPAGHRILVVDDDASAREMVTRVLAGEGYSVWQAADGAAALEVAAAVKLDLALLDLNLPGDNGLKTLNALAARELSLPIIVMTARSKQFSKAPGARISAFLEKPLDFSRLLQTVSHLLAERKESRLVHGQATKPK